MYTHAPTFICSPLVTRPSIFSLLCSDPLTVWFVPRVCQGVFFNLFFLAYLVSPKICHNFVGYLEEEAVKTYTHALHDIDHGLLPEWNDRKVPDIAINYWYLQPPTPPLPHPHT